MAPYRKEIKNEGTIMRAHHFISPMCCVFIFLAAADAATQTDWSAGPAEPGPVTAWTSAFDGSTGIAWRSIQGQLELTKNIHVCIQLSRKPWTMPSNRF